VIRVTRFQFYVYALQIVVCPFVLFLLAIVLSVILRYQDSDYPFEWLLKNRIILSFNKYSINCVQMTMHDIDSYILVHSRLLFQYYILRWPCIPYNI